LRVGGGCCCSIPDGEQAAPPRISVVLPNDSVFSITGVKSASVIEVGRGRSVDLKAKNGVILADVRSTLMHRSISKSMKHESTYVAADLGRCGRRPRVFVRPKCRGRIRPVHDGCSNDTQCGGVRVGHGEIHSLVQQEYRSCRRRELECRRKIGQPGRRNGSKWDRSDVARFRTTYKATRSAAAMFRVRRPAGTVVRLAASFPDRSRRHVRRAAVVSRVARQLALRR
jgi:hypothetical protein